MMKKFRCFFCHKNYEMEDFPDKVIMCECGARCVASNPGGTEVQWEKVVRGGAYIDMRIEKVMEV